MTGASVSRVTQQGRELHKQTLPPDPGPKPSVPRTWEALERAERAALARMIEVFVSTYNQVHAPTESELIPPCWRQHPGLAAELAVQVWLWYYAHLDPKAASPALASDYYGRHLPGFRSRVDRLLGVSPGECRRGEHPQTWRKDADQRLATYHQLPTDPERYLELLGELRFGFLGGSTHKMAAGLGSSGFPG